MRRAASSVARGMLAYALAVAVLVTLAPFDFQPAPLRSMVVLALWDDVLRNLLLLFPAGFLYALSEGPRLESGALRVLGLGLALGLTVELAQLFLHFRHSNLVDVVTNGAGAWAGALAAQRLEYRLERLLSEEFLLELPLTGSLYLLVPLLMVHGLAIHGWGAFMIIPLALFVMPIAAALYRERVLHTGMSAARFAIYVGLGFALTALPLLLRFPVLVGSTVLGLALGTRLFVRLERGVRGQRRFEARTAAQALPWFVVYLVGLATMPEAGLLEYLTGYYMAMAFLEACAALTLLGYLVGELSSRLRRAAAWRASVAFALGAAFGLVSESRYFGLTLWLRIAILGASAVAGVALHAAQVRLVQTLRERRTQASTTAMPSASNPL